MTTINEFPAATEGVPDCISFPQPFSRAARLALLVAGALAGAAGGLALKGAGGPALWTVVGLAAVAGGLLSTWSPCGYSSISLLRQTGRGAKAVMGFLPTFAMHGLGYALGAVILGTLLGAIGGLAGFSGFATGFGLSVLALIISAIIWAYGSNSSNPHLAGRGKIGVLISCGAAVVCGASVTLINFFWGVGQAV